MVHHERCPLCLSEMISVHFNTIDHFISKETFAIYRCGSCGFLFTQDYPPENEISRYYESPDYISHSDNAKGIVNKVYLLARRLMLLKKRRIIRKLTGLRSGTLLDVGCGTGHFAAMMKNSGWAVRGIEINEKARNFAASAFGLEVIDPQMISVLEAASFDCITMWHVLEHFHDPFKYVSDIRRLLKPGGLCLVALPNSSSLDAGYYREGWAAFDVPRHLWHFNPMTFRTFSEKTGFKIEGQLILPFDVFYISVLSEKYRGSALPLLKGTAMALWFSVLSTTASNRSSSVIYILRKSFT